MINDIKLKIFLGKNPLICHLFVGLAGVHESIWFNKIITKTSKLSTYVLRAIYKPSGELVSFLIALFTLILTFSPNFNQNVFRFY